MALSLASCGGQQAQEPQEPQEPKQEVQQAEPITTQPVVAPVEVKQEVVPVAPETVPEEGQTAQDGDVSSEADTSEEIDPAVELFEAVEGGEQTVYATGTVNIRSIWSIEGEKLGTLSKGEEVERVGIGKEGSEAEGWSQVRISDGQAEDGVERFKLVYVSSKYLSITKPASSSSQAQSTTSKPSTTKPSTSTSKPAETPAETQQPTEQQTTEQQPTREERQAEAFRKAQAACEARGDGSYAVQDPETGIVRTIRPGGHFGSVKLN